MKDPGYSNANPGTEDEWLQLKLLFVMMGRCVSKEKSSSLTCRARLMGLPDAQQSLSAAVGTLQISLSAMALTRRLDFRTSSRLASFLHRNLRSKALAYRSNAASVRPKRNPCQNRNRYVSNWEVWVSIGNVSTRFGGTCFVRYRCANSGQSGNPSVSSNMLNTS